MSTTNSNRRKWLRRAGLITGLLWAGLWTFFGFASGIVEGLGLLGTLIHTLVPGMVFLASVAFAWKWELIGGVVLIIEGLLVAVLYPIMAADLIETGVIALVLLTMGLPPLAAGVLYLLSCREG